MKSQESLNSNENDPQDLGSGDDFQGDFSEEFVSGDIGDKDHHNKKVDEHGKPKGYKTGTMIHSNLISFDRNLAVGGLRQHQRRIPDHPPDIESGSGDYLSLDEIMSGDTDFNENVSSHVASHEGKTTKDTAKVKKAYRAMLAARKLSFRNLKTGTQTQHQRRIPEHPDIASGQRQTGPEF